MDSDMVSRADRLGSLFADLVNVAFREQSVVSGSPTPLTYPQYVALLYVQNHPRCTVGDLARGLRISYPSATHMAQRLYQKGLVNKSPFAADKRVVRLEVTEEGSRVAEKIKEARHQRIQFALGKLEETDRIQLMDVLDRFITTMTSAGVVKAEDLCLRCGTDGDEKCPLIGAQVGYHCK
jgi:DNA-binding MarR family transcriptional regulator